MRRLFLSALLFCAFSIFDRAEAQSINNRSWKAYVDGAISDTVVLHIYGDSSTVTGSGGEVKIRLHCKVEGDTLSIMDANHTDMSCENITGIYKISLKDDTFILGLISDDCEGRSFALKNRKWTEAKNLSGKLH